MDMAKVNWEVIDKLILEGRKPKVIAQEFGHHVKTIEQRRRKQLRIKVGWSRVGIDKPDDEKLKVSDKQQRHQRYQWVEYMCSNIWYFKEVSGWWWDVTREDIEMFWENQMEMMEMEDE